MRLKSLFLSDIRFQVKYGFYFLYAVLTLVYVIAIFAVPESWKEKTAVILIFFDPASMGLYFMGAIVLLEKSQHTPCAFAVSPVHPMEYIIAKTGSLSAISLVVATVLAFAAQMNHLHIVLFGTVLSSILFTLLGIVIATKITSLNQFILRTVPVQLVCSIPAILHLFKITPGWFQYYPINVCIDIISGNAPSAIRIIIVTILTVSLSFLSTRCVLKMWSSTGGVKL